MAISRSSIIVSTGYLALVAISILPVILGSDGLGGVYAVLVTAPWSIFGVLVVDGISTTLLDNAIVGPLLIAVGALINASIIVTVMNRRTRRGGIELPPPV